MLHSIRLAPVLAVSGFLIGDCASALSIREFRKHPDDQEAVFVGAAVSMMAYNSADGGEVHKAGCIQDFFFRGKDGNKPSGPRELAVELAAAERQDADRFHVEGIILGVLDRACGSESADGAKSPTNTGP
jgi:hypothetical protein